MKLGQYKRSLNYHNKALYLRLKHNNKQGIATTYKKIGELYFEQNNYKDSKIFLLKALKIREELNAEHKVGMSLFSIAALYNETNKKILALKYYKRACEIFIKYKNYEEIFITKCVIIRLEYVQGTAYKTRLAEINLMRSKYKLNSFRANFEYWRLCDKVVSETKTIKILDVLYQYIQDELIKMKSKSLKNKFINQRFNKAVIDAWEKTGDSNRK